MCSIWDLAAVLDQDWLTCLHTFSLPDLSFKLVSVGCRVSVLWDLNITANTVTIQCTVGSHALAFILGCLYKCCVQFQLAASCRFVCTKIQRASRLVLLMCMVLPCTIYGNLTDGPHVYCTDLVEKFIMHATKRSTKACVATTCSAHIFIVCNQLLTL